MELGGGEILLILLVALLIYGGRLPQVARSIGRSLADLKRGLTETRDAVTSQLDPGIDVRLDQPEPPARTFERAASSLQSAVEDVSGTAPSAPATTPAPSAAGVAQTGVGPADEPLR